jgi:hypothetical protein
VTFFDLPLHLRGRLRKQPPIASVRPCSGCGWHRPKRSNQNFLGSNGIIFESANAASNQDVRFGFCASFADVYNCGCATALGKTQRADVIFHPNFDSIYPPKPAMFIPFAARLISDSERRLYAYRRPLSANLAFIEAPVVDRTMIGTNENDIDYHHLEGDVQWLAAWSDDIGDLVAKQLNLGAHPFFTRPRNMVAFLPMDGIDPRADWVAGYWEQIGSLTHGHRTFQLGKRQKMQRSYGRAAVPTISEGRTVVGR